VACRTVSWRRGAGWMHDGQSPLPTTVSWFRKWTTRQPSACQKLSVRQTESVRRADAAGWWTGRRPRLRSNVLLPGRHISRLARCTFVWERPQMAGSTMSAVDRGCVKTRGRNGNKQRRCVARPSNESFLRLGPAPRQDIARGRPASTLSHSLAPLRRSGPRRRMSAIGDGAAVPSVTARGAAPRPWRSSRLLVRPPDGGRSV